MWNQLEGKCTDSRAETDKQKPEKKKKNLSEDLEGQRKGLFFICLFFGEK